MTEEKKCTKSLTYRSVNGFDIYCGKNDVVEECDIKILELFTDSVSLDIMQKPIYLPCSKQIYDQTTINKWLATSNKDPLTGITIETGKLTYIPVIPYFVAMLCLELKDNKLYFHKPNMHMVDLLLRGYHLFYGNKMDYYAEHSDHYIECNDGFYRCKIVPTQNQKYVYLRNEFYVCECKVIEKLGEKPNICLPCHVYNYDVNGLPQDSKILNVKKTIKSYDISLQDILTKCPFSGRTINIALITGKGIFVHPNMPDDIDVRDSMECHVAGILNSVFRVSKWDKANSVKLYKFTDFFKCKLSDKKFVIEHENKSDKIIEYPDISELDELNFNNIYFDAVLVNFSFTKWTGIANDNEIHCKSKDIVIYEKYLKLVDSVDTHVRDKISEYANSNECTFKERDGGTENKIMTIRRLFKYPTFYDDDNDAYFSIMGGDYSLLHIQNKIVYNMHPKQCWFVGTIFEHTIFQDCRFSCCEFIGADLTNDVIFINCTFYSCSLFKAKINNAEEFFTSNNSFDNETIQTYMDGIKKSN